MGLTDNLINSCNLKQVTPTMSGANVVSLTSSVPTVVLILRPSHRLCGWFFLSVL